MVKLVLKLDCRLICLLNGDLLGHLASKINILVCIHFIYCYASLKIPQKSLIFKSILEGHFSHIFDQFCVNFRHLSIRILCKKNLDKLLFVSASSKKRMRWRWWAAFLMTRENTPPQVQIPMNNNTKFPLRKRLKENSTLSAKRRPKLWIAVQGLKFNVVLRPYSGLKCTLWCLGNKRKILEKGTMVRKNFHQ